MVTKTAGSETDIVSLVDTYARRICPAVLEQHASDSVSSPLGIWLLLAASATATSESERPSLEEALGYATSQAAALLAGFLAGPPAALRAAMALWVRNADRTTPLVEWSASLPPAVERGPVPSQAAADAWTERHTQGLIARFPVQLSELSRLVLASVLATKVSWETPFAVVAAADHLRPTSPWHGQIEQVLLGHGGDELTMLADTEAAGVVAVHALTQSKILVFSAWPLTRPSIVSKSSKLPTSWRDGAEATPSDSPGGPSSIYPSEKVPPGSSRSVRSPHTSRTPDSKRSTMWCCPHGGPRASSISRHRHSSAPSRLSTPSFD